MPGALTTTSQPASASSPPSAVASTSGPPPGKQQRRPALVDVADALERPGSGRGAQQRAEPLGQRAVRVVRVGQRLPPAEHPAELIRAQERGQDQVDEAALVAPAAPVVEPLGLIYMEGTVAAAEHRVVRLQRGEPPRHP